MVQDWSINPLSAVVLTAIAVGLGLHFTKRRKDNAKAKSTEKSENKNSSQKLRPEKWALMGQVNKLIIFPIKSCAGVIVDEAVVTTLGLKFRDHNIRDHDFMVVDKKGKPITMDRYPTMALISVKITPSEKDTIWLGAPGMGDICFKRPDPKTNQDEKMCRVAHDKNVKALDCGDEVAEWFSSYLKKEDLRVYYHHVKETQRTFEPFMYDCPQYEQTDMGAFHNETAYLLVAEESIEELNKRLEKKSSWKNWRPTILIDKIAEPFAEVNWSFVRIGNKNGILKAASPCARCALTTVDADTGIMPRDGEPLKTLRAMKKSDEVTNKKLKEIFKNKGIMGSRMGLYLPAGEGAVIKEKDPVYAALL